MRPEQFSSPELVEILRRSICMLAPGAPASNREDALLVLEVLIEPMRRP